MKSNKTFLIFCVIIMSTIMHITFTALVYFDFDLPGDVVPEVYASASEAQKFAREAVPEFLPESATQIVVTQSFGATTNRVVTEFSYSEDFTGFLEAQKTGDVLEITSIPAPKGSNIDMSRMDYLAYIQCTDAERENSKGSLIANTVQKRAMFVFPALDSQACTMP
ncbi:MAG: hypothetical protein LBP52_05480 [Burkholderiaceae bacterium]|jgi:hypothetical protein|nr:hypothetical protein [Burkholderiaceae bacterium]